MNKELQKRMPVDQLTFTSVTQSLSQSSEEFTEALSKQFSLFKTSSSNEQEIVFEERDDSTEYTDDHTESSWNNTDFISTKFMMPDNRTSQLLDVIDAKNLPLSSPLHSLESNSSGSWDESTSDSREFSLLDTIVSGDEEDSEGSATEFGEGESPRTQESPLQEFEFEEFEEFNEEDGLAALGGVLMQIGSCNFSDEMGFSSTYDEDDYSVMLGDFPTTVSGNHPDTISSKRKSVDSHGRLKKDGLLPPVHKDTPATRGFFGAMFSCHG
jgi:hypothetical protein